MPGSRKKRVFFGKSNNPDLNRAHTYFWYAQSPFRLGKKRAQLCAKAADRGRLGETRFAFAALSRLGGMGPQPIERVDLNLFPNGKANARSFGQKLRTRAEHWRRSETPMWRARNTSGQGVDRAWITYGFEPVFVFGGSARFAQSLPDETRRAPENYGNPHVRGVGTHTLRASDGLTVTPVGAPVG